MFKKNNSGMESINILLIVVERPTLIFKGIWFLGEQIIFFMSIPPLFFF